jgi:IS5 family transposase
MHSVAKANQWFHRYEKGVDYGVRCYIGMDAASGLVISLVSTAANVHELNTEEKVVYGDSGHLNFEKREEFENRSFQFRIAIRPDQRATRYAGGKTWRICLRRQKLTCEPIWSIPFG